ncbi:hypothetical protein M9435_000135 [Picochlorum sp. BPE23]|nr:hypothetical protein M9435_000135 [Picochlorum sp. BPE23]
MDGIDRELLLLALVFSQNMHHGVDSVVQGVRSSLLDVSLEADVRVQLTRVGVKQQYMVAEVGDVVFLTLPGTRALRDLLVDGNVSRRRIPFGFVHGGFLEQSLSIPVEELYRLFVYKGGKRLVLCGHSLGGALAVLCMIRMLQILDQDSRDMKAIRCFTFGSPGVGDERVKRHVQRRGWDREIVNIVVDDDPIAYMTGYYKHIGTVVRFRRTGALTLEKHRMRNYLKHVRSFISSRPEAQTVHCEPGALIPSPQITRIFCRSTSRYICIEGENLGLVTHIGIVHPASGDATVGSCKIIEKTHARLVAWYEENARSFGNGCCEPHALIHTDFHTPLFPIRMVRSVVWVLSTSGTMEYSGLHHCLLHGADVWDVTAKLLSVINEKNFISVIKALSAYFAGNGKSSISSVLKSIPGTNCILIHSNHILDDIFYDALYQLSERMTVLLSHTEFLSAELKRKIKTLSGAHAVLDLQRGIETSIAIFMESQQQQNLQYQHSRL